MLRQILRFGGVGMLATATHVGVYLAMLSLVTPQVANAAGFLTSVGVSYAGHTWFSFAGASGGPAPARALRFAAVTALGFALNAGWVAMTTHVLGLPSGWAAVFIMGVTPAVTFVLLKFWVYRDPR